MKSKIKSFINRCGAENLEEIMSNVTPELLESQSGNNVTLLWRDGRRVVHKRYAREPAFRRERFVLERIGECGVIAPQIIKPDVEPDYPSLDLSWIEGRKLGELNQETMEKVAFQAGATVARFNLLAKPEGSETPLSTRGLDIADALERIANQLDVTWLLPTLAALRQELPQCLNHRDVRFANMLWLEENEEVAIIDYETSCWGPRGADLGRMLLDDFADEKLATLVVEGYRSSAGEVPNIDALKLLYAVEMVDYLVRQDNKDPSSLTLVDRLFDYIRSRQPLERAK
ncbi:phosphotransferase family protein [Rhizobium laguerreae]|uniref:phosphotransferase family protein n=1 Tax=Rhizobium laguerreae TaxID=1076926 RepID=UPI001C91D9AC|nr:aminoglycoside phosphotransferase family protein [Rhizobium laguerreae]MBY3158012.1 phosphotransferase [Rhizobium laguerreae]MBY3447043.1 phosphotransferase [Rhizobium laguerreae]